MRLQFDLLERGLELFERAAAPAPTAAPPSEWVNQLLYGRQEVSTDQTCGYVSGNPLTPVFCVGTAQCAQNTVYNARGCCTGDIAVCTLATTCIEFDNLASECNGNCSVNPFIRKCSDTASPYCYTRFWETSGVNQVQSEFGCEINSGYTEYALPTSTIIGLAFTFTSATVAPGQSLAPAASQTAVVVSVNNPAFESPSTAATSTSATGAAATNSNSASPSPAASSGGGLSTGATIAIAVCATVVGLALIGLLAFFLWWRQRRSAGADNRGSHQPMVQHAQVLPPPEHPPYDEDGEAAFQRNAQFSDVDDDRLDHLRRFSNDGTVATIDQTVAGKTNDDYRPQAA